MRPRIELAGSIMRANVRAYAALGAPVAAVVKNDGYGWGAARIVREIDDVVESYVVADEAEFWALRMHTRRPIRCLAQTAPAAIAAICAHGGIPNVETRAGVDAAAAFATQAGRPVTIRVGIVDAAGWSGIAAAHAGAFAALCARADLRVELWTHISSPDRFARTRHDFAAAVGAFRAAGAEVAGTDVASTAWAPAAGSGERIRIGAGLFGARLGGKVEALCAIRVDAPLVAWHAPGCRQWAGYGNIAIPPDRGVAILRCGYGDGLPKELAGDDDILSVGMQYTTRLAGSPLPASYALIDERSDLDLLARRTGLGPHQLIVGLAQ